jgi:diguanylate cyclase (GGDEF)-like protein
MVRLRSLMGDGYGWPCEAIDEYIDAVAEKTLEVLGSFEIASTGMKPFSQILQEANEELGKLNLSYEQLVAELKLAKEKAERLARDLQEANLKLQEIASRDGLTGLFNHRHFQEVLARELDRSVRYGHPLSLILFDIDHFKVVNDTYGHPAGDAVLQALSQRASELLRTSDILARYGGEEFAAILPETGEKGAFVLAERVRRGIEQMQICAEGHTVSVTISLGVATRTPKRREGGKAELIAAADNALYRSKKNGRNRSSAGVLVAGDRSFTIIHYKGEDS